MIGSVQMNVVKCEQKYILFWANTNHPPNINQQLYINRELIDQIGNNK